MKIAFLGDALDLQYAGIHIYTREIIKAVTELDSKNEYFVVRPEKAAFKITGAKELYAPINSKIPLHQKIRSFTSIPSLMKKNDIDVVIEPAHFGPFLLPSKTKRVTVIHDITPVLFPAYHNSASHYVHKLFLPRITKNADLIIANSEHTKKDLEEHYPNAKGKTEVVYLGKEPQFVPVVNPLVLEKYKIAAPYLLFVGTLEPRKNLVMLVNAFGKLKNSIATPLQLVLAGKMGWDSEELKSAIANSSHKSDIIVTGYVERSELPALYSMAKIFVYPSFYEGFGLPVLEAMSCGTPVVSSNTSSLPEVGGKAALYFAPEDVNALIVHLENLLKDEELYNKHKQLATEESEKFSWEKAGKEMIALLVGLSN